MKSTSVHIDTSSSSRCSLKGTFIVLLKFSVDYVQRGMHIPVYAVLQSKSSPDPIVKDTLFGAETSLVASSNPIAYRVSHPNEIEGTRAFREHGFLFIGQEEV